MPMFYHPWCCMALRFGRSLFEHRMQVGDPSFGYIALRVCSAYRTVSLDAATLLARLPPWDLLAEERKAIYDRFQASRSLGELSTEDVKEIKHEERFRLANKWKEHLFRYDVSGVRTVGAILPHFEDWMARE